MFKWGSRLCVCVGGEGFVCVGGGGGGKGEVCVGGGGGRLPSRLCLPSVRLVAACCICLFSSVLGAWSSLYQCSWVFLFTLLIPDITAYINENNIN